MSTLDAVLDTLKGPKVVSTVSKSSIDWQNYKEKEGLEDDLAKTSKEGWVSQIIYWKLFHVYVQIFDEERIPWTMWLSQFRKGERWEIEYHVGEFIDDNVAH